MGINRSLGLALSGLAAAGLQACALNPLVQLGEPSEEQTDPHALRVQDGARKFARSARATFTGKIYTQVDASTGVSSGLIALGGLTAGLALGTGNRDAISALGILGGTTYAEAKWNFDTRRLAIYDAAVKAIDCADGAVEPFNLTLDQRDALANALELLPALTEQAQAAEGSATRRVKAWAASGAASASVAEFNKSTAAAGRGIAAAQAAVESGTSAIVAVRGSSGALVDAIKAIGEQANFLLANTVGDLSKIQGAISDISSTLSFTPVGSGGAQGTASGTPQIAANANIARGLHGGAPRDVAPPDDLLAAMEMLDEAMSTLNRQTLRVRLIVAPLRRAPYVDALAKCSVAGVSLVMTADPPKIIAPAGSSYQQHVVIMGGKPPYVVKHDGVTVKTISTEMSTSTSFDVTVEDSTPASTTANFVILDQSVPEGRVAFVIQVTGASASVPAALPVPVVPPAKGKKAVTAAPAASAIPAPVGQTDAHGTPLAKPVVAPAQPSSSASAPATKTSLGILQKFPGMTLSNLRVVYAMPPAVSNDALVVTLGCLPIAPAAPHHCIPAGELHDRFFAELPGQGTGLRSQVKFQYPPVNRCSCTA